MTSKPPKTSAESPTPSAVFRPSRATAMPTNPSDTVWMSPVESRYCQPRMSIAPASPANAPEIAIARKTFFFTLIPPYAADPMVRLTVWFGLGLAIAGFLIISAVREMNKDRTVFQLAGGEVRAHRLERRGAAVDPLQRGIMHAAGDVQQLAEQALGELVGVVDTVIVIPNERLMGFVEKGTSFFEAFRIADDILRQAVQGIGEPRVDFQGLLVLGDGGGLRAVVRLDEGFEGLFHQPDGDPLAVRRPDGCHI